MILIAFLWYVTHQLQLVDLKLLTELHSYCLCKSYDVDPTYTVRSRRSRRQYNLKASWEMDHSVIGAQV